MSGTNPEGNPSDTPPQPHEQHKPKPAVIYVRQSTAEQVRNNIGSTEAQRALSELPRKWGWPASHIIVIEDDLAMSGTSSTHRAGFRSLLDMIDRDRVGIVLVREMSRLSRDPYDSELFLRKAQRHGVLIEVNGRVHDPEAKDASELFGLRIHSLLGWWENQERTNRFQGARKATVLTHKRAVSRPPIGYVKAGRGVWMKDPDPHVREAVRRVFDLYLQLRSAAKVALYMLAHGLLFPRRIYAEVRWRPLAVMGVVEVIDNPNYTEDYCYRRHRVRCDDTGKRTYERRPRTEWYIVPSHHEAYITAEEYETIQRLLHQRGSGKDKGPPQGRGHALCQGLVVCDVCGNRMLTAYNGAPQRDGRRTARYSCVRKDGFGVKLHQAHCSALLLDGYVVREALATLTQPTVDLAISSIRQHKATADSARAAQEHQLRQANAEVAHLLRRVESVDPSHQRVKVAIEASLEAAIERRDLLRSQFEKCEAPPLPLLSDADARELLELTADIDGLWHAATTTNEDRKALLATMIDRLVIHSSTKEFVDVTIEWQGGARDTRRLLRPKGTQRLVAECYKAGDQIEEIQRKIRVAEAVTLQGRGISRKIVVSHLRTLGRMPPGETAR